MTRSSLEVVLSPAEFPALARRDLSRSVCVVFDILRATTSMITALASGARAILPVGEIAEAVALRRERPEVLLAGERDGLRIRASQTGAMDFDLGNSPREFTPAAVADRTIVMTTTNGTRALRACAGAEAVLAASFLNLGATTEWLRQRSPASVILVCGGTYEEPALEDILAAGAVCGQLWPAYAGADVSDGAEVARRLYLMMQADLLGAMQSARNGRRLLGMPELRDDVTLCVQRDTVSFVAGQGSDGAIRRL